jgi:hypothetical protein
VRHVRNALADETAQPLAEVQERAPADCHYFSELEASLSEWSFAYGIAWALIRTRDPFMSSTAVDDLAREATRQAWRSLTDDTWTALMAADRERRGPVSDDGSSESEEQPQHDEGSPERNEEPQLDEFMGKLALTRRRPTSRAPRSEEPEG